MMIQSSSGGAVYFKESEIFSLTPVYNLFYSTSYKK